MKLHHLARVALVLAAALSIPQVTFASNPVPLINQPLVPGVAAPGGPGFTLTVNGTGFVSGSVVNWNGYPRATIFISPSQLKATIAGTPQLTQTRKARAFPEAGGAWVWGHDCSEAHIIPVSMRVRASQGKTTNVKQLATEMASARTLLEFVGVVKQSPVKALDGHLRRGDFSRWIAEVFGDYPLAKIVQQLEEEYRGPGLADVAMSLAEAIRSRDVLIVPDAGA